jgi:UDP-glucose 4-epimerase
MTDKKARIIKAENKLIKKTGYGEITEPSIVRSEEIIKKNDIIVHLASITALPSNQIDTVISYQNNVMQTLIFLEMCRNVGVSHFIFASSCCVYENNKYTEPIMEDTYTEPTLIYSLGKKHCEELIKSYHTNYGLPYTIFRLFNVYGPGADSSRQQPGLIPYFFKQIINNNDITLYADGEQRRDYIFIDDVIDFILKVIKSTPSCTVVNVSSGITLSVNQILNEVKYQLNKTIEPVYKEPSTLWDKFKELFIGYYPFKHSIVAKEVVKFTIGDTTKAKTIYNWEHTTTLSEGIKKINKIRNFN